MKSSVTITLANNAGFCFGVQRAVDIAFKLGAQYPGRVFTIGPIIHNPSVVKLLEEKSVHMVNDLDEVEEGIIIVRSHGLPPAIIEQAKGKGLSIVDATCPFVKKVQTYALSLRREGYPVLLIGDREHPEVLAIRGYIEDDILICQSPRDLTKLAVPKRLGVVEQTTQDYENFKAIVLRLLDVVKDLKIYNTICDSTIVRRQSALKLAKSADMMIVIGGRNSANTNRLASICRSVNSKTHLIETADELDRAWFNGVRKVGISAGASTPKWLIDDVVSHMDALVHQEMSRETGDKRS
ncbi:MAG: 4-hydroxy-3-methylbut-2-enyl diphosphate reductase [bacterium]